MRAHRREHGSLGRCKRQKGKTRGLDQCVDGHSCRGGSGWGDHMHGGCRGREDSWGLLSPGRVGQAQERCGAQGSQSPRSEGGDAKVSFYVRPGMKFVLCVWAALSACCDKVQLWFQDQACALAARAMLPHCRRCWARAPAATVLVALFCIGTVHIFSTTSPVGFEQLADYSLT